MTIDFLAAGNDGYDVFESYAFTTLGTSYQQGLADMLAVADLTLPEYQLDPAVRVLPLP